MSKKYNELANKIAQYCGISIKRSTGDGGKDCPSFSVEQSPLKIRIWTRGPGATGDPAIRFYVFNDLKNSMKYPNVVGPWLREQLDKDKIVWEEPDSKDTLNVNSIEGQLVLFPVIGNPEKDSEASILENAKQQFSRLNVFFGKGSFAEYRNEHASDIASWNENAANSQKLRDYRSRKLGGDQGEENRGSVFSNLEEKFKKWLGPRKSMELVGNLKAIGEPKQPRDDVPRGAWSGLVEYLTGKQPIVGVFKVQSLRQFEENYKDIIALSCCKKEEKKQKKLDYQGNERFDKVFDYLHSSSKDKNGDSGHTMNGVRKYIEFLNEIESWVVPDILPERPRNLIYFGAPGTGKSHQLKVAVEGEEKEDGTITKDNDHGVFVTLNDDQKVDKRLYERVTFYPTYSYAQFVGCYKPVMKPADGGKEEITYEFVPGPFLRMLVKALEKPNENHCLVIEEINRANAAAVFGDVFQLLDRGSDGVSEYDVAASEDVKKYLDEVVKSDWGRKFLGMIDKDGKMAFCEDGTIVCRLRIPSNMYIWATMNSADQGVFPMDTAFKRRWEFEYVDINNGAPDCTDWTVEGKGYKWDDLRRVANELLSLHHVNEDKLMGTHFVKPTIGTNMIPTRSFESKVLMYLWEDAARMCRRQFFGTIKTFYALLTTWENSGIKIFENNTEINNLKENKGVYETLKNSPDVHDKPEPGASMDQPQP